MHRKQGARPGLNAVMKHRVLLRVYGKVVCPLELSERNKRQARKDFRRLEEMEHQSARGKNGPDSDGMTWKEVGRVRKADYTWSEAKRRWGRSPHVLPFNHWRHCRQNRSLAW